MGTTPLTGVCDTITLATEVLFEQFSICTAACVMGLNIPVRDEKLVLHFQTIIDITGARGIITTS